LYRARENPWHGLRDGRPPYGLFSSVELVVVGALNLGGSIDPLYNAIDVVELAVEKGAVGILIPVSARKQLFDLSDEMATRVNIIFYTEARDALIKAVAD
jgi:ATP-dependent Lon protease